MCHLILFLNCHRLAFKIQGLVCHIFIKIHSLYIQKRPMNLKAQKDLTFPISHLNCKNPLSRFLVILVHLTLKNPGSSSQCCRACSKPQTLTDTAATIVWLVLQCHKLLELTDTVVTAVWLVPQYHRVLDTDRHCSYCSVVTSQCHRSARCCSHCSVTVTVTRAAVYVLGLRALTK